MSSWGWLPGNSPAMRALQELVRAREELSPEEAARGEPEYEREMLELMSRLRSEMLPSCPIEVDE